MESAESAEGKHSRLNSWVAITVALLATFMGICKVKDDNIVQAMQQAQADKLDHWSFYQARNIRQEVAQASLAQLTITRAAAAPAQRPAVDSAIVRYKALVADQADEEGLAARSSRGGSEDLRLAQLSRRSVRSVRHVDRAGDLDARAHGAHPKTLALLGRNGANGVGRTMGLAGLLGWALHPDSISRLLS